MVAWKDALEDAEAYLMKVEDGFSGDEGRITVSLCSLALIKASDALFYYFYDETPSNHDNASAWFQNMYSRDHHIETKYSKYKGTLDKWVKSEKAKAQYHGKNYSKTEARRCLKATRRYLNKCVKPVLKKECC